MPCPIINFLLELEAITVFLIQSASSIDQQVLTNKYGFLSRERHPLVNESRFLVNKSHFLSRECHSLTCERRFLVKERDSLSRECHPLTNG